MFLVSSLYPVYFSLLATLDLPSTTLAVPSYWPSGCIPTGAVAYRQHLPLILNLCEKMQKLIAGKNYSTEIQNQLTSSTQLALKQHLNIYTQLMPTEPGLNNIQYMVFIHKIKNYLEISSHYKMLNWLIKVKKIHLYKLHIPPQWHYESQTGPAFSIGCSQVSTHGLWPAAIQPHIAIVYCFNGLHLHNLCKYMDYYSLLTPDGWKAKLAVTDSLPTIYR